MSLLRVRSRLRNLASRVLGPQTDEATTPPEATPPAPTELTGLPPLQPGRGETPGPNHKSDISQEWASAQLHSGVPPFFVDLRAASDYARGHIPGAVHAPDGVEALGNALPSRDERIAVYDHDGEQHSGEAAAWLRAEGWGGARRLVGGFEAWQAGGDVVEGEPEA